MHRLYFLGKPILASWEKMGSVNIYSYTHCAYIRMLYATILIATSMTSTL